MYINLKIKVSYLIVGVLLLGSLMLGGIVLAGDPDSTGEPSATSSYSLEDLYQRLVTGTVGSSSVFTEPSTAPGTGTMFTINEIMAKAPVLDNTNGVTSTHVLTGQTFWGLTTSQWATQTGTMTNNGTGSTIVPTTTNQSVVAGYWSSANTVQGDNDLAAGNIKQGVTLFGVDGTLTSGGTVTTTYIPKTGITVTLVSGDDGDLEKGVAWPTPRFITSTTGIVTDTLTGLVWLEKANCFQSVWAQAFTDTATLNSGECGLSDGSVEGDWRLPNVREMLSLAHYGYYDPAVPNTVGTGQWSEGDPFIGIQSAIYWSSSTRADDTNNAWRVHTIDSSVYYSNKTSETNYVWPVRGGQ